MDHIALLFPCGLLLASCTVGPDFLKPDRSHHTAWKETSATRSAHLPDDWWRLFHDSELNRLMQRALTANPDLAAAKARVQTARALVGIDRARMFPRLDLHGGAGINRASEDTASARLPSETPAAMSLETENYRGTFDLSYDADLWGRNRRMWEASSAQAAAADALWDAHRLGLATEVARQYFLLCGLDEQEQVIRETIQSRQDTLDLLQSRLNAGLTDGLAPSQARTELELANNDLAMIRRQRGAAENALAVLCGSSPADFKIPTRHASRTLPDIRAGLPADVLNRRPDIRAAEQELRAANARIGVAQAAFYPNFSLSATGGFESVDAGKFLDWQNRVLALGANVTAPVFNAGSNKAAFDAAVSRRDEALAIYKNTLLVALREVEDAFVDLKGLARSRSALEQALASANDTMRISQDKHDKGLSSYLEVVEAGRTVLRVRLALAQIDAQQRVTLAVLAKSLGGGWTSR